MGKPKILIQLDVDDQPSTFDSVVAVDCGVDHLFRHHGVTPENVESLVHGAMFTRGIPDLKHSAIFVGGSHVEAADRVFEKIKKTFFGPKRVSIMHDANGSNTTAAAAVYEASRHVDLSTATATVLAGTGPVGQRISKMMASKGASVNISSRYIERATDVCDSISESIAGAKVKPIVTSADSLSSIIKDSDVLFSAGAAGFQMMSAEIRKGASNLKVAIDLNAVPPVGLEGIDVMDKASEKDGQVCYGAIGVGGTKMKIHKACILQLFESNEKVLDTDAILAIAESIGN